MTKYILETVGIEKTFPGVKALNNINVQIEKGEIHGIVGENGAGKSTLMAILSGIYIPDKGKILLDGKDVVFKSPHDANIQGIGIVHQELSIFPNLSVAENIFVNSQSTNRVNLINSKILNKKTEEMLSLFEIDEISPETLIKNLSIAQQQVIEILKAFSINPKILILDEPTSSLTESEKNYLFKNLRILNSRGISIIYISHHLKEVFEICNRVTILKDGNYVTTVDVENIDEKFLIAKMVGREISDIYDIKERINIKDKILFEVKNIARGKHFKNISFTVKSGEIVGLYGLLGAGKTEIGRAIFGADRLDSGEIFLEGKRIHIKNSNEAIENKIGYMTEDRKLLGLYLKMNIFENFISNHLRDFSTLGFMNNKKIMSSSNDLVKKYNINTPSIRQKVNNLSGGNQQKLLLSTWFGINPKILIVDEPTRGVDVGARTEIYKFIRKLAGMGAGIIVISSDVLEIIGMSDKIIIIKDGIIVDQIDKEKASEEIIISKATGIEKNRGEGKEVMV